MKVRRPPDAALKKRTQPAEQAEPALRREDAGLAVPPSGGGL